MVPLVGDENIQEKRTSWGRGWVGPSGKGVGTSGGQGREGTRKVVAEPTTKKTNQEPKKI